MDEIRLGNSMYGKSHLVELHLCIYVVFEVLRDRQGLVSAGDPCDALGGTSLPERVAHALLPIPIRMIPTCVW